MTEEKKYEAYWVKAHKTSNLTISKYGLLVYPDGSHPFILDNDYYKCSQDNNVVSGECGE